MKINKNRNYITQNFRQKLYPVTLICETLIKHK